MVFPPNSSHFGLIANRRKKFLVYVFVFHILVCVCERMLALMDTHIDVHFTVEEERDVVATGVKLAEGWSLSPVFSLYIPQALAFP